MAVEDWPPADEFADRLAKLRRVRGVSNQAIADATGVGVETVSKWAGGQAPKADKLLALARYFGVSAEWLLSGEQEPEEVLPKHGHKPVRITDGKKKGRQA